MSEKAGKSMAGDNNKHDFFCRFRSVYEQLNTIELLGTGRAQLPWRRTSNQEEFRKALEDAIAFGASSFPLRFDEAYIKPLSKNIGRLVENDDIEICVGAVYDLGPDERVCDATQCLLAVMSNFNRSFLGKKRRILANFPLRTVLPPLATFRYEATIDDPVPFILNMEYIYSLFKGKTSVVCLPSTYIDHTLLWSVVAHEAGGHDILNADPTLLPELESDVRSLMGGGPVYPGKKWSRAQFLGFLWQYWLEESAADVYAILNMGPAYALGVAAYTAALNQQIYQKVKKEYEHKQPIYPGEKELIQQALRKVEERIELGKRVFTLNVDPAGRPYPKQNLNTHPTDYLRLYLLKGAIEGLNGLQEDIQGEYLALLQEVIDRCTPYTESNGHEVLITGYFQAAADTWVDIDKNTIQGDPRSGYKKYDLDIQFMAEKARTVGSYIATAKLNALDGHSIQDLETWDDMDEHAAKTIRDALNDASRLHTPGAIDNYGDDAQLLAGAMMAFLDNPDPARYREINLRLKEALLKSFERDRYWGRDVLHPIEEVEGAECP